MNDFSDKNVIHDAIFIRKLNNREYKSFLSVTILRNLDLLKIRTIINIINLRYVEKDISNFKFNNLLYSTNAKIKKKLTYLFRL